MLAMAGTNAVSVVLLGTLCLLGLTGRLAGPLFVGCLAAVFVLVTVLWIRTEQRHRAIDPFRRAARVVVGLLAVIVATPMVVLTPLFWLERQVPAEAGFTSALSPVMAAVLLALVFAILVNVAGGAVVAARALLGARRSAPHGNVS